MTTMFLIFSLWLPRLTLLYYYLTDRMPENTTSFSTDLLAGIFAPRLLIAYWTTQTPGVSVIWTFLFIMVFLLVTLETLTSSSKRIR